MKKLVLVSLLAALIGVNAYSQFAFGVSPGLNTNTAYFGFKVGPVVPYVGFQMLRGSANISMKYDYYDGAVWTNIYDDEIKGSVGLYMPEAGIKFFAISVSKLKAYLNLNVTKPIIRGKLELNGTEEEEFAEEFKKIKIIGGNVGFGVEYFFDDNFSVGGEYGLQLLHAKYDSEETDEYGVGEIDKFTDIIKVNIAPTYAKICLNFYFGGKGRVTTAE